jgi:microcystin-dependent protein
VAEPFLSEIRMMSFSVIPKGWAQCNGQLLPINQNQALFALLGTTFGGDGRVNFGLPNLQGNVPIHVGNNHILGERGGEQTHTLTVPEMARHTHFLKGSSTAAETNVGTGAYLGMVANTYTGSSNTVAMGNTEIGMTGGSQPHVNMQPFLTISFCIALQGIFPSPN